jgi:hypothetical protein
MKELKWEMRRQSDNVLIGTLEVIGMFEMTFLV